MVLQKTIRLCLCFLLCSGPAAVAIDSSPEYSLSPEPRILYSFPGNHGFIHQTGYHVPYGWAARYRIDLPGYFIRGRVNGGEPLEPGTYRYVFYLGPQSGSLGGLLYKANDIVRVEAWDKTANERLVFRTFQTADFLPSPRGAIKKTLVFSTWKRADHRFEPRIYWTGMSGIFLKRVDLERLDRVSTEALSEKAMMFEQDMDSLYLDRGFVLSRDIHGDFADQGDAAIWTGLYAASQAWRYHATHSKEALARMESSLRALHELQVHSDVPGTLIRYFNARGDRLPDAASKDSYTGFFFAIANGLPYVKDRALRKELLKDVEALGNHLLDHDLAFVPLKGEPLELNPFLSPVAVNEGLAALGKDPNARRNLIRMLEGIQLYFLSHGQRPWPELLPVIKALKHNDIATVQKNLLPVLNGALRALAQLQRNVQRSDNAYRVFLTRDRAPSVPLPEAPYGKLNILLLRVLNNFSSSLDKKQLDDLSNAKLLPSQALHALHFIKIAGEVLPKPNRFDAYYKANLWENKALLKTVLDWHNIDDDCLTAIFGHTRACTMRNASRHLSYLALYDLIQTEKDESVRGQYRTLFEEEFLPMQEDYNAMLHIMRAVLKMPPDQLGVGLWSLTIYPTDRRGRGAAYWASHHDLLAARYGGDVQGQARDPVSLNDRQRDAFIWQRSARSIGGDSRNSMYPPLDYLFVYWLARANRLID